MPLKIWDLGQKGPENSRSRPMASRNSEKYVWEFRICAYHFYNQLIKNTALFELAQSPRTECVRKEINALSILLPHMIIYNVHVSMYMYLSESVSTLTNDFVQHENAGSQGPNCVSNLSSCIIYVIYAFFFIHIVRCSGVYIRDR